MRLVATDIEVRYEVVKPFRLPFHAGSMLRGILGRALRVAGCVNRQTGCKSDCEAPQACIYARLFDPPAVDPPAHAFLRGQTRLPQPLIPNFPPPGQVDLDKGETFGMKIRVLGPMPPGEFEVLLRALERVSDFEFGQESGRVGFEGVMLRGCREAEIAGAAETHLSDSVQVVFETPAWLEQGGRLMERIEFQRFFRAIYRRLTVLCALYGELGACEGAEFLRLDGLAGGIAVVEQDVKVLRWQRRSLAREREHPLQGLMGRFVVAGAELGAFRHVLSLAEKTHIGKATSHGLGRIRLEV